MARKTISCIGDSLTDGVNPYWGTSGADCWPHVLQTELRASERDVICRNFGVGGNTTAQMLARIGQASFYDTPSVGVIYGGANDPGSGINSATTTSNIVAMASAILAAGATGVAVVGQHYKNWTSGGDTTSSQEAVYAALRIAQQAAVTALTGAGKRAIYVDLYAYMSSIIVSGAEAQGSNCWSAVADNQHLNAKRTRGTGADGGHDVIGRAVYEAIVAAGWLDPS